MEAERVLARRDRGDVATERAHRARGRRDDPVEQFEQRRLARAVGAQQRDLFAEGDVQVDAVERDVLRPV